MAFTAGRVQVPVVPTFKGFQKSVARQGLGAGGGLSRGINKGTSGLGAMVNKNLKRGLKFGAIGAAITAGLVIKGGITRLMGIEDARASLSGLGHDAKTVNGIMANALAAVKGTAFGMADAGKTAASMVAAGVKPGKDLEKTLRLVADGATIAKVGMGEMGAIFGKVAASNKLQGDVIAQLNDKGVPIVQMLSESLGKSTDEVLNLSKTGKISFKDFSKAMDQGLGGAALKSGDTMRGSFANMNAALGRIGANLLSGFFPKVRGGFQDITKALGPMEDKAAGVGAALGDFASKYGPPAGRILVTLGGALKNLAVFGKNVVTFLWDYKTVLAVLAGGMLAYKAIVVGTRIAEGALAMWRGRQLIAMYAVTVAQRAMNTAMRANPIGIVITALTLLGVGLVLAYKKSSTFRRIVNATWAAIKIGLAAMWGYVRPVLVAVQGWLGKWLPVAFNVFKRVAGVVFKAIGLYVRVWWFGARLIFAAFRAFLTKVIFPVIRSLYHNVVKPIFTALGSRIAAVWRNVIKPTFEVMRTGVGLVKKAFQAAVTGTRIAWDKLRAIVKKPIVAVVGIINKGLITPFNSVSKALAGKNGPHVDKIVLPKDLATGGTVPGQRRPYGDKVLTHLAPGEEVITNRHGEADRFRAMRKQGMIQGLAKGGTVWPAKGGTSKHSGYPWARWAGDINQPGDETGAAVRAYRAGRVASVKNMAGSYGRHIRINHAGNERTLYAHLSKAMVRAGQMVTAGMRIGSVGSTGNSSGPHLHFEIAGGKNAINPGGSGGGLSAGVLKAIADPKAFLMKKMTGPLKALGDHPFAQLVKAMPKKLVGVAVDKIKSLVSKLNPFDGPGASSQNFDLTGLGSGIAKSANQALGQKMAGERGWTGGQWKALKALWDRESGWRVNADNPRSSAYGIPQALPGSKMASAGRDWRTNPQTQIKWGLGYIRGRYGSPAGAWAHSKRVGWYDNGGWLQPGQGGVNMSSKPEPVFSDAQWATLKRAVTPMLSGNVKPKSNQDLAGAQYQINVPMQPTNSTPGDVAEAILFGIRRHETSGVYAGVR